ncbi:MAG TPA: hypothetical protein PK526_03965 [bacterium]|nr:hypothetical protein [bacterium]
MKKVIFLYVVFIIAAFVLACISEQKPDKYPITYVAISPAGFRQDITYICGNIRYLPDGRVRCLIRYIDDRPSKDSVDFPPTTQIISAANYFID